jgi:hypothetical protein
MRLNKMLEIKYQVRRIGKADHEVNSEPFGPEWNTPQQAVRFMQAISDLDRDGYRFLVRKLVYEYET